MHYDIFGPPEKRWRTEAEPSQSASMGGDEIGENSRPLGESEAPANYKGCYRINEHHNAYPDEIDSCEPTIDAGA